MDRLYSDLAIAIFFLVALIFVRKNKPRIDKQQKSNFDLIAGGISFLALLSITTAIQNQLPAQSNSWSKSIMVLELIRLTLLIAGTALVTAGVSKWLRNLKDNDLYQKTFTKTTEPGCELFKRRVTEAVLSRQTINEKLVSAKNELQRVMPVDFISIGLAGFNGDCRRISIGLSGTILNEIDIDFSSYCEFLKYVCQSEEPKSYTDITQNNAIDFPELFTIADIKSLMAVPLNGAANCQGAIIIGAVTTDAYSPGDSDLLSSAELVFTNILNDIIFEQQAALLLEREKLLREFIGDICGADSLTNTYEQAAKTIRNVVKCPFIRLSTVEVDGKFLSSQARINLSNAAARCPENGRVILSYLPWHKTAWDSGNTVVMNGSSLESSLSEIETTQIFVPGLKRAAIVPIKFADRVYGLISMAEACNNKTIFLSEANISLVETIASVLSVILASQLRSKEVLSDFASMARGELIDASQRRGRRSQMKSSLSSIIGAVELINTETIDDDKRQKFLSIIAKSAQRMSACLTE